MKLEKEKGHFQSAILFVISTRVGRDCCYSAKQPIFVMSVINNIC